MVALKFTLQGLQDLDKALGELPKATARNVLKRTLRKGADVLAPGIEARLPSPGRTGKGHLRRQGVIISESPPEGADAGKAAYAQALSSGASKSQAAGALRAARSEQAFARLFIGLSRDPAAQMQEFGNSRHPPQPSVRPEYDAKAQTVFDTIASELGGEIEKSAQRLAKRRARKAAKG